MKYIDWPVSITYVWYVYPVMYPGLFWLEYLIGLQHYIIIYQKLIIIKNNF